MRDAAASTSLSLHRSSLILPTLSPQTRSPRVNNATSSQCEQVCEWAGPTCHPTNGVPWVWLACDLRPTAFHDVARLMLASTPDGAASSIVGTGGVRSHRHRHSVSRLRLVGIVRIHLGQAQPSWSLVWRSVSPSRLTWTREIIPAQVERSSECQRLRAWGDRSSNCPTTRGVTCGTVLVRVFLDRRQTSQCAGATWTANHGSLDCHRWQ